MKGLYSLLIIAFFIQVNAQTKAINLDSVRLNYMQAVSDKKLCLRMIDDLKSAKAQPIYLGYLGGLQTVWAKHVLNPFEKLKTFKQGKENIEKAILQEPQNPELRFIRLSVQKNAPSFLGYNSMIGKDERFLELHRTEVTSKSVLKNIEILLKD